MKFKVGDKFIIINPIGSTLEENRIFVIRNINNRYITTNNSWNWTFNYLNNYAVFISPMVYSIIRNKYE